MHKTNSLEDEKNDAFINRRREQRLPTHIPSLLIQKDMTIYTTIVSLSSTGIGFLSAVELAADDEVKISFERLDANTMKAMNLAVQVHACHPVDVEYYVGGSIISKPVEYTKFFEMIKPAPVKAL
jgi:hypothetical protein